MAFSCDTFTFHKTTLSISPSFVQFYKLTETSRLRFVKRKRKEYKSEVSKMAKIDKIHSDAVKTYKRKQCGYSCSKPSILKTHTLVHSGGRPFVCSQCNYSCKQASHLRTHIRTHSGEMPYQNLLSIIALGLQRGRQD